MTFKTEFEPDASFLHVLTDALSQPVEGCIVNRWLLTLNTEYQEAFAQIKANASSQNITGIYRGIEEIIGKLPFAVTAFKRHFGDYCPCKK